MKRYSICILLVLCIVVTPKSWAQSLTINNLKAGALADSIPDSLKYTLRELKISGELNGTDISLIRLMSGGFIRVNEWGKGVLEKLDISDCSIVKGGNFYVYAWTDDFEWTSDNTIGKYMFWECRLKEVILPKNADKIEKGAFMSCNILEKIILPENLKSIGLAAFEGCKRLADIQLPENITAIEGEAFCSCDSLKHINIPSGIKTISYAAFQSSGLVSVEIPEIVTSIEHHAFFDCTFTSVEVPVNVETIGRSAFSGGKLQFIYVAADNMAFTSSDGVLYNKEMTTLIQMPHCWNGKHFTIPESVTTIGYEAFVDCDSLTELEISANVTTIENEAFADCNSLTELKIPASVTTIGNKAFADCNSLTELKIPASVTNIGTNAFIGCSKLENVWNYSLTPQSCADISEASFFGNADSERTPDLNTCVLHVPLGTADAYKKTKEWGIFRNIVEFDVAGITTTSTQITPHETARYLSDGRRIAAPVKGINIIHMSDGSIKKMIIK